MHGLTHLDFVFHFYFKKLTLDAVPPTYPMDEDLIKLCLVNQLQKLGLADHFTREIEDNLDQLYRYLRIHIHI